jgi:trimethylamine--corrinoid protein Co-methyltransferase
MEVYMRRLKLEILTKEELEKIHHESLIILEEKGLKYLDPEGLEILAGAGAKVDFDSQMAKLPADLVEDSLKKTPSSFNLYNRNGELAMVMEGYNTYYGGGGFATYFEDYENKKIRYCTQEDMKNHFILGDALSNYEFMHGNCYPADVPRVTSDRWMWALGFTHQTKHLIIDTYGRDSLKDVIDMAVAIRGSFEEVQKHPIFCIDATTLSPLAIDKNQVQHLIEAARNKLPVACHAGAIGGGTAPITLAGIITQCNAEVLGAITLLQQTSPNTPFLAGSWARHLDMKKGNLTLGSAEFALMVSAHAQLGKFYNIPTRGGGLLTDAHISDAQAGFEKVFTCFTLALAGLNFVSGMGLNGTENTLSLEQLVIDDEIINYTKRMLEGINVTEEKISTDLIMKVGPGGSFLAEPHTLQHFKEELWDAKLAQRFSSHEEWEKKGALTIRQKAHEVVKNILESHTPEPLDKSVEQEIWGIVKRADEKYLEN